MKTLASQLSLFISVLISLSSIQVVTASPANEEQSSRETCSVENTCPDSDSYTEHPNDCCPGGVCNPFESCYSCGAWNISYPSTTLVIAFLNFDFSPEQQINPVLGFRSDCFHPPEGV